MFFDTFSELCKTRGISVYKACTEMGLNRSAVAKWKGGATPNGKTLATMSEFFGVPVDYLLGELNSSDLTQKEKPLVNGDEELTEYLEELRTRPEMKMLFQLAKGATKEDVEKAVKIIETLLGK